ncbi:hypothetical protein OAA86_06625 [Rhodospirillales bacterium]|nr:hypothetical protein [Rhodospirillales bacterium]
MMAGLTDDERLWLAKVWDHDRQDDPPLTKRDFKLIDWAVANIRPNRKEPRPSKTAMEIRRVCLLAAKRILETGCTKQAAMEWLLGDGENGVRYVFKNKAIGSDRLNSYLHQKGEENKPEWFLRSGLFQPADRIAMEIEDWEWAMGQLITDGAPENW